MHPVVIPEVVIISKLSEIPSRRIAQTTRKRQLSTRSTRLSCSSNGACISTSLILLTTEVHQPADMHADDLLSASQFGDLGLARHSLIEDEHGLTSIELGHAGGKLAHAVLLSFEEVKDIVMWGVKGVSGTGIRRTCGRVGKLGNVLGTKDIVFSTFEKLDATLVTGVLVHQILQFQSKIANLLSESISHRTDVLEEAFLLMILQIFSLENLNAAIIGPAARYLNMSADLQVLLLIEALDCDSAVLAILDTLFTEFLAVTFQIKFLHFAVTVGAGDGKVKTSVVDELSANEFLAIAAGTVNWGIGAVAIHMAEEHRSRNGLFAHGTRCLESIKLVADDLVGGRESSGDGHWDSINGA